MKKVSLFLLMFGLVILFTSQAMAGKGGVPGPNVVCTTIQNGVLIYSPGHYLDGQPISVGKDIYGYNYQARKFDGTYANVYLGRDGLPPYDGDDDVYLALNPSAADKWYWPYRHDGLSMDWNGPWLDNRDCAGDNKLDRHYGHTSYIGSGAWLTNHQSGSYMNGDQECKWIYFVKITAAPSNATLTNGIWYDVNNVELGPAIWGSFVIRLEVESDTCTGVHGRTYGSPAGPGFGKYGPE